MSKLKFKEAAKSSSFLVFFASQTGQAESIADCIVQQAQEYEFNAHAFPLNDVRDLKDLTTLPCPGVIVASTTGDGEPPESGDRFWRRIRKKILEPDTLSGFKFALLGLGDTNYNQFCNCGKEINRRLLEIGATSFYDPGWADDAVGLELVVEDWIENLWTALEKLIRPDSVGKMSEKAKQNGGLQLPICPPASLKIEYDEDLKVLPPCLEDPVQPYPLIEGVPIIATIMKAQRLTKPGSVKTALEITLKCPKVFNFQPGDAVSIVCPNPSEEVDRIIKRLNVSEVADKVAMFSVKDGAKGKLPVFIPPGASFRQILTYYSDIRSPPKKNFIRLLSEYTDDEQEKGKLLELCSKQGSALFESTIRLPALSLLDFLLTFPSCNPPPEVLVEHLPRLIPRPYSISSSPLQSKDSFTFAFNVITVPAEDGRKYARTGVCTGWLYKLVQGMIDDNGLEDSLNAFIKSFGEMTINGPNSNEIIIYRRKGGNFRLPADTTTPVIMVGPGTGVAPFIGFSEQRKEMKKQGAETGTMLLYFGCRNKELDFLYQDKMKTLVKDGVLTRLFTSFSRDSEQNGIKYVQHNMAASKEELVELLLDKSGYFYVCGDARNMAKNVRDALIECIKSVKGVSDEEAKKLVATLVSEKRYLQDVWS